MVAQKDNSEDSNDILPLYPSKADVTTSEATVSNT
jgi:hypothetical protein